MNETFFFWQQYIKKRDKHIKKEKEAVINSINRTYVKVLKIRVEEKYISMEAGKQAAFRGGRSSAVHAYLCNC